MAGGEACERVCVSVCVCVRLCVRPEGGHKQSSGPLGGTVAPSVNRQEGERGATPSAHRPPTGPCNSTPEITIAPWALGAPHLPLLTPLPLWGSLRRGQHFHINASLSGSLA